MNTIELTLDMMSVKNIKRNFKGVFPSDRLPKRKVRRPAFFIVNTDPSRELGTHWVAFHLPVKGPIEYMDSTGKKLDNNYFKAFINRNGKKVIQNNKRLQGSLSTTCGNYCGVFLYLRSKHVSLQKFLDMFSDNYQENDLKVLKMYQKIFQNKNFSQIGGYCIPFNQTCKPCDI